MRVEEGYQNLPAVDEEGRIPPPLFISGINEPIKINTINYYVDQWFFNFLGHAPPPISKWMKWQKFKYFL